jgi:uncharacterized protein
MAHSLPEHIRPANLARGNRLLTGECRLDDMQRLQSGLVGGLSMTQRSRATLSLEFESGSDGIAYAKGTLGAVLASICQRCLEPMEWVLNVELRLAFVDAPGVNVASVAVSGNDVSGNDVPVGIDSIEVVNDELNLWALVEDELILALPITPLHEENVCQPDENVPDQQPELETRSNPFAALSALKDTSRG